MYFETGKDTFLMLIQMNQQYHHLLKLSRKILGRVEDGFSVHDKEGPSVGTELAKKVENVFFESSGGNIKLQKIMKEYKHPANLLNLKSPKINPEIKSSQ